MGRVSHELYHRQYDGLYRNIHATPGVTTPKAGPWGGEIIPCLGLAGRETDKPHSAGLPSLLKKLLECGPSPRRRSCLLVLRHRALAP